MAPSSRHLDRRRRLITGALSGAIHVALLAALVTIRPAVTPAPAAPELIPVILAPPLPDPPPPPEPEPRAEEAKSTPPKKAPPVPRRDPPPPKRVVARVTPAPPTVVPVPAAAKAAYGFTEASDGDVAGASTAEGGGGGSGSGAGCDMTRRLQAALRKDRQAQAAMSQAHRGRPIMMWNGDWVRHPSQEGAGLAAVREAILWEVGFAPEACKTETQRGMVLISMNDGPGAARLVVGSGAWRWQDLLFTRGQGRRVRN
ncbi:hypothetical protein [Phenylobacterium sp.]|uniref:hypothetical protein n=1 Tax=Phenylobacterium sp. TaxID=1871053 RepID=UPI003D27CF84